MGLNYLFIYIYWLKSSNLKANTMKNNKTSPKKNAQKLLSKWNNVSGQKKG